MTIVTAPLAVLRPMRARFDILVRPVLALLRDEATCRRLTILPGVGPITALAFRATVGIRIASRSPAPLAPISPDAGALSVRRDRHSGANHPLRRPTRRHRTLRGGANPARARQKVIQPARVGVEVARRRRMARARVAVVRKRRVVLHRMWRDRADFRLGRAPTGAPV